jgi:7-cyano-7-deazaguanine synthase
MENENKKAVVVLSGGMDSTTLLYDVVAQGYETYAISFDYNQKHNKELGLAKQTCEKLGVNHRIVDLSVLNQVAPSALTRDNWEVPEGHYEAENMKETVVPNRNMVLISLASAYAMGLKAAKVFYGAHGGDHAIYPDCRPEFAEKLAEVIKIADWNVTELEAPYLKMDKGDIVTKGKELNVDYSLTWTCYKGKEKACGKCGSCQERLEAFKKAGIDDPIEYE